MKILLKLCLVFIFLNSFRAIGDPVRISFLNNSYAINSTANFLISKGCDRESVNLFCKVLNHYNSTSSDLDLNGFPEKEAGFYCFHSMTNLTVLIRSPLIYVKHEPEL